MQRDLDAATKWLKMSADQNNPFAAYLLGRIMADRDSNKAPALYKAAAEQGLPQAQYFYAKTLKDGHGVQQDRLNAYVWFTVALDAHYSAASTDLSELESSGNFTTAQISEAKAKARDLEQRSSAPSIRVAAPDGRESSTRYPRPRRRNCSASATKNPAQHPRGETASPAAPRGAVRRVLPLT